MNPAANMFDAADKTTPGYYGSTQTALLLLDFHSLFVQIAGGAAAPAALTVAAKMASWARSQGIQVIHGLVDVNSKPCETCKDANRLVGIISAMKEGDGEEPAKLTEGAENDITFTRTPGHVSALKSLGLTEFLQRKGIKSLVLTGLSTSGCVMRTAVAATDAEYVVTTISDACADPGDGVHDMMIGKILNNRGYVCTAAEFQEGLRRSS